MEIKQYYKSFLTLLSGNTLAQIIPFIAAPIISRIYSPDEIGTFSNLFAIISLLGIIASGRLELAIPIVDKKRKAQDLVFSGLVFTSVITLLSFLLPIFKEEVANFYNDQALKGVLWIVPISVFAFGILLVLTNWILRNKQYKYISINKVLQAFVNNVSTIGFGLMKMSVLGLILGWLIGHFSAILLFLKRIKYKVIRRREHFNVLNFRNTVVEFKDFPLINSLHAFMDIFATQFLLFWIITKTFGSWEFGIYAMMFKYIRGPISLITSSVSQMFYVETGNALNNKKPIKHLVKKTVTLSGLFGLLFSIVILLFGSKLFQIYLGEDWKLGGNYAQCILPILFFTFIVSPISGLTILFKKQYIGFLLSFANYFCSLFAFVIGIKLNWSFEKSLLLYSAIYSIYFIVIILWYNRLINVYEKSIIHG